MIWHGLPIPRLVPKTTSSIGREHVSHRREESRGVPIIAMPPTISGEVLSSRAHKRSEGVLPSAPPMPEMGMHSTFESRRMGPIAHEVPLRPMHSLRPTVRMMDAKEEASAFLLG